MSSSLEFQDLGPRRHEWSRARGERPRRRHMRRGRGCVLQRGPSIRSSMLDTRPPPPADGILLRTRHPNQAGRWLRVLNLQTATPPGSSMHRPRRVADGDAVCPRSVQGVHALHGKNETPDTPIKRWADTRTRTCSTLGSESGSLPFDIQESAGGGVLSSMMSDATIQGSGKKAREVGYQRAAHAQRCGGEAFLERRVMKPRVRVLVPGPPPAPAACLDHASSFGVN